jgi:hypothetical protein
MAARPVWRVAQVGCLLVKRCPRTLSFVLHVGASEGWIQLGGEVPNAQVQAEAETVAASVPAVRGVLGLPYLSGGPRIRNRRALQPRIGSTVYADDGEIGKVAGIVLTRTIGW